MAKLTIHRTRDWSFRFVSIRIWINNELIGSIRAGKTFEKELPEGSCQLQASFLNTYSNVHQLDSRHGNSFQFEMGSDVNMLKNLWVILQHPVILVSLYFIDKLVHWDYFLLSAILGYLLYVAVDKFRKKSASGAGQDQDKYYIYLREIKG